jgi:hypothetical protein
MLGFNIYRVGLNFDQARTNNAMTHVLVLNAKVRKNKQLWQTLDICNMFEPTFWLQRFIVYSI